MAALSSTAFACTPKHTFGTLEKGTITVAVSIYAPYTELSSSGEVGGVDGDIVRKIADMECLHVKGTSVSGAAAVESVASNRADITVGGIEPRLAPKSSGSLHQFMQTKARFIRRLAWPPSAI